MKKNKCIILFCLFLLTGAGCTSLATDEDWEKNGRVHVVLDWGTRASHSGVFDYYFYAEGSHEPLVRRGDASGYEGTLPQGRYSVVACNPDGSNLDLSMKKGYAEARAVARTTVAPASISKASGLTTRTSATVISPPGNLYGTGREGIAVSASEGSPVVMAPACLVKEVQLNILIQGGGEVSVVNGLLSGIPPEICIPTGKPCAGRSGTMTFTTHASGEQQYTASLSLFGLRPGGNETVDPSDLALTVQQKNGQSFTSHTDVTGQVSEVLLDGLTTRIELDMEVHPLAAGGFTLVVTGWRTGEAEAGTETDSPDNLGIK